MLFIIRVKWEVNQKLRRNSDVMKQEDHACNFNIISILIINTNDSVFYLITIIM